MFQLSQLRVFTEPQQGATYDDLLGLATAAERLGFGAFFRSDHYLAMGPALRAVGCRVRRTRGSPAGLARDTSRIRLGTLVTSATFRHLAYRSLRRRGRPDGPGRVELGLWLARAQHTAYGIPFPGLGQALRPLGGAAGRDHRMWSTPAGERFLLRRASAWSSSRPRSPAAGGIPVIVGGHGAKRTPELAARC